MEQQRAPMYHTPFNSQRDVPGVPP